VRTLYLGTGDIGIPAFESLGDSPEHVLLGLVCQPDKPVGRKQVLTAPRIKEVALGRGIEVFQPRSIRRPEALAWIRQRAPDVVVVMAYGQILPPAVLDAPRLACLNLHASILPKYRGASPIQAALRAGDSETGITVIHMDEGLDTGDILLIDRIPVAPHETGGTLHDRLAELAPSTLLRALDLLARGNPPRLPQDHAAASQCGKLEREDGRIDWNQTAAEIERLVRAYDPWPGTATRFRERDGTLRALKVFPPCEVVETGGCPVPGTLLDAGKSGLLVATGGHALRVHSLQPENGRRMDTGAFLAGHPLAPGDRLF